LAVAVVALTGFGVVSVLLYQSRHQQQQRDVDKDFNVNVEAPAMTSPTYKIPHPTPMASTLERYSQI